MPCRTIFGTCYSALGDGLGAARLAASARDFSKHPSQAKPNPPAPAAFRNPPQRGFTTSGETRLAYEVRNAAVRLEALGSLFTFCRFVGRGVAAVSVRGIAAVCVQVCWERCCSFGVEQVRVPSVSVHLRARMFGSGGGWAVVGCGGVWVGGAMAQTGSRTIARVIDLAPAGQLARGEFPDQDDASSCSTPAGRMSSGRPRWWASMSRSWRQQRCSMASLLSNLYYHLLSEYHTLVQHITVCRGRHRVCAGALACKLRGAPGVD